MKNHSNFKKIFRKMSMEYNNNTILAISKNRI